jgi:hypothetical protein
MFSGICLFKIDTSIAEGGFLSLSSYSKHLTPKADARQLKKYYFQSHSYSSRPTPSQWM